MPGIAAATPSMTRTSARIATPHPGDKSPQFRWQQRQHRRRRAAQRDLASVCVPDVDGDERQVGGLSGTYGDGRADRLVDGPGLHDRGCDGIEQLQPALAEYPFGRFDDRTEDGGDRHRHRR
jgi:hypothetical protein